LLGESYVKAINLALSLHEKQVRKGGRIPYVSHLLGVSSLILKAGGSEEQAIGGLLHDAIEDQGEKISFADLKVEFGELVAEIVLGCTDETLEQRKTMPWYERKHTYLSHLKAIPLEARLVILSDKLDNIRDMSKEFRILNEDFWLKFTEGRKGSIWFLGEMEKVFRCWQREAPLDQNSIAQGMIEEFCCLLSNIKSS